MLKPEHFRRYSRHLLVKEIGIEGQSKLLESKALIIGCGGLGTPAALYLVLAGIGTIGLMDHDVVDISNLHRQILYTEADVGKSKLDVAARELKRFNDSINIVLHKERATANNIERIIRDYDVILGCVDNMPARYLINDACYINDKILVDAAATSLDGLAACFIPQKGCYRCIFGDYFNSDMGSCSVQGVIGALTGVLGSWQATKAVREIIKSQRQSREPEEMLVVNAWTGKIISLQITRNPDCTLCGDNKTIFDLTSYIE